MNENYWNDEYWKNNLKRNEGKKLDFLEDIWVSKYDQIVEKISKGKALDLGCGLGQYTKYMQEKGFDVVSADISIEVLNKLKETIPNAEIIMLDMSKELPFKDNEFELIIANLSIHYFDKKTTTKLLQEINRILKPGGYFIGSVNSSKGYEFIKDKCQVLEENYYFSDGRNIRLWNKEQFDEFFSDFKQVVLEEVRTVRWTRPKDMWEFIYCK